VKKDTVAVIACAVLGGELKFTTRRLGLDVDFNFLEAGLHERPDELHQKLQAAIDKVSATGRASRIIIGYGICGRGTIGIRSRDISLVMPRVHDCIAMLLGGNAAYRREFKKFPGTYYVSAGWHKEKAVPASQRHLQAWFGNQRLHRDDIARQHGDQAADQTIQFLNSWQRNYQRAAYIDTDTGKNSAVERYAREMAEEYGWAYEKIQGSLALFEKMLTVTATTDEILVVAPRHAVDFDAVAGVLSAKPLWAGQAAGGGRITVFSDDTPAVVQTTGLGLGIDAGGTYTDAVVYDFKTGETLCKAKALTTRWDFTVGIGQSLEKLDPDPLRRVKIVALSTTLATNAIVEGDGQRVGLLLMPPYGLYDPKDYPHTPKALVPGRLSITGEEIEPVDEARVRQIIRHMVAEDRVGAFAVSGFAGAINPDHEIRIKQIVGSETDLFVTCGHELSTILDFKVRATTAVLNARIVPRLGKLIADLEQSLRKMGMLAPIVVVKGDGTLMSAAMAKQRPVETIFSGPAASVAGARHLTGAADALVVDMGGTTTDTAALEQGRVRVSSAGSTVAGRHTHVRALDIRTAGLGGDSLINREKGIFCIGPRRVAPIAWLASHDEGTAGAIAYLDTRLRRFETSTRNMQILAATGSAEKLTLMPVEEQVLSLLRTRPRSIHELIRITGAFTDRHLSLDRLEENFVIQRCGLTPTDLLHVAGVFERWQTPAAKRYVDMIASLSQKQADELVQELLERVSRNLALEILKRQLDEAVDPDALATCPVCRTLMKNLFEGGNDHYRLHMEFKRPVIGIGAPVAFFLPRAAAIIGARFVLPEHADVANAIGAITSNVVIERQIRIVPGHGKGFFIEGLSGTRQFEVFEEADAYAKHALVGMVRTLARDAGTSAASVTIETEDQLPEDATGHPIFIGRLLKARLAGPPDRLIANSHRRTVAGSALSP
jgi:N-methylhydantoinase A/oxoprolinase/acetone carboxylase beta subunit